MLDRYYIDYGELYELQNRGEDRHWLVRAKKNLKWKVVKRLGRGNTLVEITLPAKVRKEHPEWPETFLARAVQYRRKGFRTRTLLTSLLDPKACPASEIAELYHERWELELGYDELKTDVLEREEAIRSETPDGVLQRALGHGDRLNLVRREMDLVAREMDLPPRRLSFITALRLIRDLFYWVVIANPGALPKRIQKMRVQFARLILPPRRSDRRYPRYVKIKMSGDARNRKHSR